MGQAGEVILGLIVAALAITVLVFAFVGLVKVVWRVVRHVASFIGREVGDAFRLVGAGIVLLFYVVLTVANLVVGRWSGARHYGRGVQQELANMGRRVYRLAIGNPARLFMMKGMVEGVEERLPEMVRQAPGADAPPKRTGIFEGYTITGSLPTGGSGSKLYIARPDAIKRAGLERAGFRDVGDVVIKSFSLGDGSSLPQIVRESRSLDAARKLGLILDHELMPDRFYYVMRYVPGQSLALVTKQLHASGSGSGLEAPQLRLAMAYIADLLRTLERYHQGGLWHKDVKPDNIIVDGERAHLVDFGLVTPLHSAMTLTTHGTEYFRDPEMVRLALKGVKVHDVDGTRFDIYGAGAVFYAVLEDSFPAHGVLSPFAKPCPEALRWIVRRAMTDYDKRYATAGQMLGDLEFVRRAPDALAVKPIELPSMRGASPEMASSQAEAASEPVFVRAAGTPPPIPEPAAGGSSNAAAARDAGPAAPGATRPRLVVEDWFTGRARVEGSEPARDPIESAMHAMGAAGESLRRAGARMHAGRQGRAGAQLRTAAEQVAAARDRVRLARERAAARAASRRTGPSRSGGGAGIALGVGIFFMLLFAGGVLVFRAKSGGPASLSRISIGADGITIASPNGPMVVVPPHAPTLPGQGESDPLALGLPRIEGRALVVSDLLPPIDDEARASIERGLAALRDGGLELVEAGGEAEAQMAAVRFVRGTRPLTSPDSRSDVRAWLDKGGMDAVVWVSRESGGAGPGGLFHLITRQGAKADRLGTNAAQWLEGLSRPARQVLVKTVQSGGDAMKMLEEAAKTIAEAQKALAEQNAAQRGKGRDVPRRRVTGVYRGRSLPRRAS